jgi:glyoxalase superfamily protein
MHDAVVIASWKDLCIDAVDVDLMARFWAGALGREVESRGDLRLLTGPTPRHSVWINPVPEPVTVKQRVHLDVHVAATDDVLALGATMHDPSQPRWDVLRDPEGGELCTFPRERVPDERLYEIIVGCADPSRLTQWWGEVLGGRWEFDDEGYGGVESIPGAPFEYLVFVPVPEPKTVKNRIHWDVDVADVQLLLDHGATVLREPGGDIRWTVLADPEGNEFCAFVA